MKLLKINLKCVGAPIREERNEEGRYTLTLRNEETQPIELIEVEVVFEADYADAEALFLNGYQSWTYCPERTLSQTDSSMRYIPAALDRRYHLSRYSDAWFTPALTRQELRRGVKRGWSYAYARRGETYHLFASLAEDTGFTRIELDAQGVAIRFVKDCCHRLIQPGKSFTAFDLLEAEGGEGEVFDAWFAALGRPAPAAAPKTGYTSWYNCYQNISEAQILRDLEGMKTLPVKPDIFQIDDGFEPFVGDWLTVNPEKFPNGLEPIVRRILDEGYQAGIWLAPFVAEKDSALFREHPDWLLREEDGSPVSIGCNWSGSFALDVCNPAVRDYIRQSVERFKAMGVTLFKLDFLYAACMLPRPDKTRGELMAEAMDFLREVCGDCQILGCGVPLASAFGRVEYCRIGPDMSLSFDDKPLMRLLHNERPSTLHTQRNTFYRRQLDGRAFRCDPDVFLLREENTTLRDREKHTLAVVNALFGSVLFGSDDFGQYDEKKRRLFAALCSLQTARVVGLEQAMTKKRRVVVVTYELDGRTRKLLLTL